MPRTTFSSLGPRRRPRRRLVFGLAGLLVLLVLLGFLFSGGRSPHRSRGPATRVLVLAPPGLRPSPSSPAKAVATASSPSFSQPVLAPLPPPSGKRILPVPQGASRDFVSPSLSLPAPPSGWYLQVGEDTVYARAHRLLERFVHARFRGWISPRATAAGSEIYRVWIGPYRTRARVETMMLRATALSGAAPEIVRHRHGG